jgi:hypothetical protein
MQTNEKQESKNLYNEVSRTLRQKIFSAINQGTELS